MASGPSRGLRGFGILAAEGKKTGGGSSLGDGFNGRWQVAGPVGAGLTGRKGMTAVRKWEVSEASGDGSNGLSACEGW